jgi:parvulin-like peptidyl-prolyl isomerase
MWRKSLFLLVVAFVLGSLAGCKNTGDQVVATVGKLTITVSDIDRQYNPPRLLSSEEMLQQKRDILDAQVNELLKVNEAEARGYADNEDLKKMLEDRKRVLVVNQLYTEMIINKVKVSPSEVKRTYELMGTELDLKDILVATEEEAKAVHDSIVKGADFDAMAVSHSTDAATRDKGGSLGWTAWGKTSDQVFDAAYKMTEGQVSDVVKDNKGWHILKLESRRPVESQRPWDTQKNSIEFRLKQNKMRQMGDEYLQKLKDRTAITYNEDVVKSLAEKTPAERVSPWGPPPLPVVTDADRELVLATTNKGEWTVGKVMDLGVKVPPRAPPSTPEAVKQWVDMMILQEELVGEALKMRLDRSKEVVGELRRTYRSQMANLLQRDEVEGDVEPTEEEMRSYYEANKEKYAVPERNWVSAIVTSTEDQALDVLRSLRKGADFKELAKEKSTHASKQAGGNMGIIYEKQDPELFGIVKDMKVDRLSDPVKLRDGWAIIKVTRREEAKMPSLDEARQSVARDVRQEKMARAEDRLLAELTKKYSVEIHEDMLQYVGKEKEDVLKKREEEKKEAK